MLKQTLESKSKKGAVKTLWPMLRVWGEECQKRKMALRDAEARLRDAERVALQAVNDVESIFYDNGSVQLSDNSTVVSRNEACGAIKAAFRAGSNPK